MGVDRHLATPGVEILLGVLGRCLLIGPMGLLFFSKKKMVGKDETLEVPFCLFVVCGIFVSPRLFGPSFFFFFFFLGGGGGRSWLVFEMLEHGNGNWCWCFFPKSWRPGG